MSTTVQFTILHKQYLHWRNITHNKGMRASLTKKTKANHSRIQMQKTYQKPGNHTLDLRFETINTQKPYKMTTLTAEARTPLPSPSPINNHNDRPIRQSKTAFRYKTTQRSSYEKTTSRSERKGAMPAISDPFRRPWISETLDFLQGIQIDARYPRFLGPYLYPFRSALHLFVLLLLRRRVRFCSVLRSSRRERTPLRGLYKSCRVTDGVKGNGAGEVLIKEALGNRLFRD